MSILLVTLFVGSQLIRIQHFLKKTVYQFLKNLTRYLKNVFKKNLRFLELLYKKKEKIPIDFLIDEIDVDSYFFHKF